MVSNKKEYMKKYRQDNREIIAKNRKEYRENNKEKIKIYNREYHQKNKELITKNHREYYENNKEKEVKRVKIYQTNNREKRNEIMKRAIAKRKRNLGYNPLNEKFLGSVGHHINRNDVVYMPEKIHASISHSILNNRNMEEINMEAMKYIGGDFRHI